VRLPSSLQDMAAAAMLHSKQCDKAMLPLLLVKRYECLSYLPELCTEQAFRLQDNAQHHWLDLLALPHAECPNCLRP
jgi:hypothetical protein